MKFNLILANLLRLFHIIVVFFILLAPFSNRTYLLILHIVSCISLLIHWHFNDNTCSLTLLEGYLRGKPSNTTFVHQFIAPIYNVSLTSWDKSCYFIVIFLMMVSMFKLKTHASFIKCQKLINSNTNDAYKKCFIMLMGGV